MSLKSDELQYAISERVPISLYLINGIRLRGTLVAIDQYTVLLNSPTSHLVYKHAIASMVFENDGASTQKSGEERHPKEEKREVSEAVATPRPRISVRSARLKRD